MLNEQGGELVAVLRGANAPLLQKMIVEELTKEKLVLEQGGKRKVVSSALPKHVLLSLKIQYLDSSNICVLLLSSTTISSMYDGCDS